MADAFLPVLFADLPAEFVFEHGGRLRWPFEHAQRQRVVRIIAGPTLCDVIVDIRRPYNRPPQAIGEASA